MNEIALRLNAYIQKHPFDSGDSDCETVLDQLYQTYAESHESDPAEIGDGFKELEEYCRWRTTMPSLICAAACAVHMNAKPFGTDCNMVLIYLRNFIDKRGRWCKKASAALCVM